MGRRNCVQFLALYTFVTRWMHQVVLAQVRVNSVPAEEDPSCLKPWNCLSLDVGARETLTDISKVCEDQVGLSPEDSDISGTYRWICTFFVQPLKGETYFLIFVV
jgi:hypothetical protein